MFIQHGAQTPRGTYDDGVNGQSPRGLFWDTVAPTGASSPWNEAALGSVYVRKLASNVAIYVKSAANSADADWVVVSMSTALLTQAELDILDGATLSTAELNILDGVLATTAEINRVADASTRIVDATGATLAVTEAAHDGKVITLNRAASQAVTLPAATGSGTKLHFIVGTTVTTPSTTIKVTGNDIMTGVALIAQDGADTAVMFETAADSDTITLNGTTMGGIKGDSVELIDIAADLWWVRVVNSATSTEATPFSATVT